MKNWYEVKITYDKDLENGTVKKVTEAYLIDALSFTEAEVRAIEELKPYTRGEFSIVAIKREKYSEIFFNDSGDRYFKARVCFIALDEKSGTEKKTATSILVQASNIDEAQTELIKGMKGTLADYEIPAISETKLIDVFPYS